MKRLLTLFFLICGVTAFSQSATYTIDSKDYSIKSQPEINALTKDGSLQYVHFTNGSDALSISAPLKAGKHTLAESNSRIYVKFDMNGVEITLVNGTLDITIAEDGSYHGSFKGSGKAADGKWHRVVGEYAFSLD